MATAKKPTPAKKSAAPAKRPAAPRKPAAKAKVAPAPQKPAVDAPVAATAPAVSIPYHYVANFLLEDDTSRTMDGILTIDAPITDGQQYEGVKQSLVNHFKLENVKGVVISSLNRLDTLNLNPRPAA